MTKGNYHVRECNVFVLSADEVIKADETATPVFLHPGKFRQSSSTSHRMVEPCKPPTHQ